MRRRGWILVLVAVLGALLPVAHAAAAPL